MSLCAAQRIAKLPKEEIVRTILSVRTTLGMRTTSVPLSLCSTSPPTTSIITLNIGEGDNPTVIYTSNLYNFLMVRVGWAVDGVEWSAGLVCLRVRMMVQQEWRPCV